MKKVKNTLTKEARKMYGRVKATRNKAQWIGMLYVLATIVLAALAVLPTLNMDYVNVLGDNAKLWEGLDTLGANVATISRVLYVMILLAAVCCVFKSLGKLNWLYKRKASKTYGFNRNVYAMQAIAQNFATLLAVIIANNFLIVLLNGAWGDASWTEIGGLFDALKANSAVLAPFYFFTLTIEGITLTNMHVVVVVGVLFHLFLGFWGGKISFFVAEEGVGVSEEKRLFGRFSALVRNIFQIVFSLVAGVLILEISSVNGFVVEALGGNVSLSDLAPVIQLVLALSWIICLVHTVNPTEYNLDGAAGKGMKNYGFFMFVIFGVSAYYFYSTIGLNFDPLTNELLLVAVAFVACLLELLIKAPHLVEEEEEEEEVVEYDEEGNPITPVEEPVIVETDDIDWRYFFSDEFVGGEVSGVVIR